MSKKIYKNARLFGELADLEIADGKFQKIGKMTEDGIDLGGLDVFPGLVDIHCHGAVGLDAGRGAEALERMSIYFAENGITTWYPTTAGGLANIRGALQTELAGLRGANMPGFHLEGPYISPKALGAMAADEARLPDPADFAGCERAKLITIAPELAGALDYIKNTSMRVAIGHTAADYDTAIAAIEAGATCLTHTFNAMPPLHHRNPGVIGAAIDKNIYAQVICDGVHLHRSVVTMLYRTFGKERMILISDAVAGTGLPDGEYLKMGKHKRIIKDGAIRTESGNLAGSACNLYMDVKTAISFGIPRDAAFYMASTTPATYMGINKGRIEVGYDADFIVVNEQNDLLMTVIGGEVFKS